MAQYTKQLLSASSAGKQIVVGNGTVPGNTLHVASSVLTDKDEIWLYCTNSTGTAAIPVTLCWGGTTSQDQITTNVYPGAGRQAITDGKLLTNGLTVSAFSTGTVSFDGFVNRISADLDQRVVDWANRVVINGGAVPSFNTQQALTLFVQGLIQYGLYSKMQAMNCYVPDSFTAALTPLIRGGYDPWVNHSFISGDLTVNGLAGNASTKYLDIGLQPANFPLQQNSGFSYYAATATATGFIFGCYTASVAFMAAAKYTDNNAYAYNGAIGNVVAVASPGAGFYSSIRISSTDHRMYFANSTRSHAQIGATDTTSDVSTLTANNAVAGAELLNGSLQFPSSDRLSFLCIHNNMTATDSANLFSLVQNLRIALGGGFV